MTSAIRNITTAIITALIAVLCSFALALPALADDLADAETAANAAKEAYDEAVSEYESALEDLDYINALVEESQYRVDINREKTMEAARFLYRDGGDRLSVLLEIILSGQGLATIIAEIDAYNTLYEYNADLLERELEAMQELQEQKAQQEAAIVELEAQKDELEAAMEDALAAYEALKPAETSSSSGSSSHNWTTGDVPCDITISVSELRFLGVVYANGFKFTWYSSSVLPGGALEIPDRHIEDGMVCDGDGYVCVASNDLPKGTVVPTPLGRPGKVYDSGCASGTIDLYLE